MKCTKANFTKVMKIADLSLRKAKLQSMALDICWHGEIWNNCIKEISLLNDLGVKTPLEKAWNI